MDPVDQRNGRPGVAHEHTRHVPVGHPVAARSVYAADVGPKIYCFRSTLVLPVVPLTVSRHGTRHGRTKHGGARHAARGAWMGRGSGDGKGPRHGDGDEPR